MHGPVGCRAAGVVIGELTRLELPELNDLKLPGGQTRQATLPIRFPLPNPKNIPKRIPPTTAHDESYY